MPKLSDPQVNFSTKVYNIFLYNFRGRAMRGGGGSKNFAPPFSDNINVFIDKDLEIINASLKDEKTIVIKPFVLCSPTGLKGKHANQNISKKLKCCSAHNFIETSLCFS